VNIANADIANNALITNVYRNRVRDLRHANRDVPGAFMTMPREALASEQPVPNHGWRSSPGRVSGWAPPSGAPDVEPLRRFRIHSAGARAADSGSSQSWRGGMRTRPDEAASNWRSSRPSGSERAWQPSQRAQPSAPSAPSAAVTENPQGRTAPREWGHGVRIPENASTRSNNGSRTYGTPLPSSERTYGRGDRSSGGNRAYGAPIRYGTTERSSAAPPATSTPRYTTPNTRGSDRPISRQSYSPPPAQPSQPSPARSAAPRGDSGGARVGRGDGRAMRQPN
jgi:hypothetical protein